MNEKEATEIREKVEKMIREARSVVEEARNTARELKRGARREMRKERKLSREERKKEKMLNLRIGEDLEGKLRSESERLKMPVSSLVRNILDNAFDLVDGVTRNVGDLVEDVVEDAVGVGGAFRSAVKDVLGAAPCADVGNGNGNGDAECDKPEQPRSAADLVDEVSVWSEVTIGKPAACASCSTAIPRWFKAHAGECDDAVGGLLYLCEPCMEKMRKPRDV